MKRSTIFKQLFLLVILGFCAGGAYYLFLNKLSIYDFNAQRDTAFVVDFFKKNWYWLVAGPSDFTPESMVDYYFIGRGPEGREIVKVLYKGTEPVGFVSYSKKNFHEGFLHFLAIREEFRSKGYGLKLLKYAIKDLLARGCIKITLVTRPNNYSAQTIYKKVGFKQTQETDGYGLVHFEYQAS